MKLIAWLRTPTATLIVLCAALVAQLPHAADVFRIIVSGTGLPAVLHGYAYAVALELAVLLFVVQRRNVESYVFACVSVCVNLSYYALHGVALFSVAALPAWLVSIALPAAIARYSHLLVETPANDDEVSSVATVENVGVQVATNVESGTARPETPGRPKTGKKRPAQKLSANQRRAQIASAGATDPAQVAAQFGVSVRTAQTDIASVRKSVMQRNGVHA